MTLLNKIPGTVLILLGALCLSFGGIIVKSFEGANLWQILFWRQTFFAMTVALYLLISYKKNFFKSFFPVISANQSTVSPLEVPLITPSIFFVISSTVRDVVLI